MKCDLHVHTTHSGMCHVPVARKVCRESYTHPLELYQQLKLRGMDLVTVTDHDSIGAADWLRRFPDFFVSEEVSCTLPGGSGIHVAVYDITEAQHVELQRRRDDIESFFAFVGEQNLLFGLNHMFSGLTGRRRAEDWEILRRFPALETRNGQLSRACNEAAETTALLWDKMATAGSDAHTRAAAGLTWTEVPRARTKREFLDGIRRRTANTCGQHGSYAKLTSDVLEIVLSMVGEHPWTIPVTLLLPALATATACVFLRDHAFKRFWQGRISWSAPAPRTVPVAEPCEILEQV